MSPDDNRARALILELLGPSMKRADLCADDLDDSFNVVDAGLLDSIGFMELLAQVEQRRGVPLDLYDADPDRLTTLGGLVELAAHATPSPPSRSLGND
jgi:acyl carrier protein